MPDSLFLSSFHPGQLGFSQTSRCSFSFSLFSQKCQFSLNTEEANYTKHSGLGHNPAPSPRARRDRKEGKEGRELEKRGKIWIQRRKKKIFNIRHYRKKPTGVNITHKLTNWNFHRLPVNLYGAIRVSGQWKHLAAARQPASACAVTWKPPGALRSAHCFS